MRSIVSLRGIAAACLFALCAVAITACAAKRNFAGTWSGSISVTLPKATQAISIGLTFHVTKNDDGSYASTLDVPMQSALGLPVQTFAVDADKVTVTIKLPTGDTATFTGTSNSDATEISGTFVQNGNSLPLKLTKAPDAK
jgi:hypothetical protein